MAGATLKSVAQRAGVSVSTASRALSGNTSISAATRANVVAAAKELGYRLNTQARALRRSRTDAIGLIIPSLVNPFFAEMAAAVEEEALRQGFATIISSSAEDADKMVNAALALADRQVDGIIVVPMEGTDAALSTIAASRPLLLLDRQLGELPAIVSSPAEGMKGAITRLRTLGHTRIGYLAGPQDTSTGRERLAVFNAETNNLNTVIYQGSYRHKEGYVGTLSLLKEGVTAIIAGDSMMTFGALEACHNAGITIGEELALVGFDDFIFLRYQPTPLSVIDQDVATLGTLAARSLITAINSASAPVGLQHPTRFISRLSSAYPPTVPGGGIRKLLAKGATP